MQIIDEKSSTESTGQTDEAVGRHLLDHHREHLRLSGLTDEIIRLAGIYSVTDAEEARATLGWPERSPAPPVPAIAFPYQDCGDHVRLRPDTPRKNEAPVHDVAGHNYAANDDQEPPSGPKYESPRGQPTRLYIPSTVNPDILNPNARLWLTEGEKKALAACQAGLPTVAAPGVDCFGDAAGRWETKGDGRDERTLHPDFGRLSLPGREVVICFDSDIDGNPAVLRAAVALHTMLAAVPARTLIAYLDAKPGEKVGLDDAYAALSEQERAGPSPLGAVEDSARPFNPVECLEEYLAPNWDDWGSGKQDQELRRAVNIAQFIFPKAPDFDHWVRDCARALKKSQRSIRSHLLKLDETSARFGPEVWIAGWAAKHGVTYDYGTERLTYDGKIMPTDVLLPKLVLDAFPLRKVYPRAYLEDAYKVWVDERSQEALAGFRERVRFREHLGDGEVRRFVRAVTGDEDYLDIAVVQHFIWQVKRKLSGKLAEHHLMPIIVGPQGGGKSEAIRRLVAPLEPLVDRPVDMECLTDERQAARFSRSYIVFFDEMPKVARIDTATLKQAITRPTVKWRIMKTTIHSTQTNAATFIGASNEDVISLIADPTGMRRFWELKSLKKLDWGAINAINYDDLWASIDPEAAPPLERVLTEIQVRQDGLRRMDEVEEFLLARCLVGTGWTPAAQVYAAYKVFQEYQGARNLMTLAAFGRRLKALLESQLGPGVGWKKSGPLQYALTVRPGEGLSIEELLAAPAKKEG